MEMTNKKFMELNADELQREIDYLWGQYDYVFQCEYLPEDIKNKQLDYLNQQLSLFTSRYIFLVTSYVKSVVKRG